MDAARGSDWNEKAAWRLADFTTPVGDTTMNRWRQRLAEIDSDGAPTHARHDVQNVRNAQSVQNSRPSGHFVQIGQIERRLDKSAASLETLGDAPYEWREHIRGLNSTPCPEGFPPERWLVLRNGAVGFAQQWAAKAMSLGWTFDELFALREPFANVSLQGAAWFVGDATVTAVTADAITLRTEGGATQRVYRKPRG
jgi:hypothetical protein